jgi:hypothetical protein
MKAIRNVTLLSISLLALALFAAAPAAYAGTITYSTTQANASDNLNNETVIPVIDQFNNVTGPYAGDLLNSVTITFVGTGMTTLTATDSDLNNPSTNVGVSSTTAVTLDSSISSINALLTANSFQDSVSYGVSGQTVAPNSTQTWGPHTMNSAGGTTDTFNSGLGIFEGTGDLGFELNSSTFVSSGATGGSFSAGQKNNGSGGIVTVTYDYSLPNVPEPGSLTLFGTGLLGLAGMLRRKFMASR